VSRGGRPGGKSLARTGRGRSARELLGEQRMADIATAGGPFAREILEHLPIGVALVDADGRMSWANELFDSTVGMRTGDCQGRALVDLLPDLASRADAIAGAKGGATVVFADLEAAGAPTGRRIELRLRDLGQQGSGPRGIVAVVHDVTERRRLEAWLQSLQRLQTIGRLTGGVAHDLNNLLGVIRTCAEYVRRVNAENEPARDALHELVTATDRAVNLTRQLLAFGRGQPAALGVLAVDAVVVDLERMLRLVAGDGVALRLALHSGGRVLADRGQLEQVLMNLVVHARDATPRGGAIVVETANAGLDPEAARRLDTEPGAYVVVSVIDSGTGMDEATKARIFEPFFTTKADGAGTGLGLAVVQGIVAQAGGRIAVTSTPGAGSIFRVYLPRLEGGPSDERQRER